MPCRDLVRTHDWASSPLGPIDTWPATLRGYVAMVMELPTPAILFWGPDQLQIYNDGYAAIMGPRHPTYFGAPFRLCWPEAYAIIIPWMRAVLDHGAVKRVENALFTLTRHGFTEEAYFTFTFSPLRDDTGAIAGLYQPVVEATEVVLADRRARTIHALTAGGDFVAAVASNPEDLPFGLVFLRDEPTGIARLAARSGLDDAPFDVTRAAEIAAAVLDTGAEVEIADVDQLLGRPHLGCWAEPTRAARALPVRRSADDPTLGVVILGISPRLRFDAAYEKLFHRIACELGSNLSELHLQQREQAARRDADLQREHLSALLSQAPTPITVLRGPTFVVEVANAFTRQLWGRDDVIGRPLFDVLPELRGQVFERLLEDVLHTGITHVGANPIPARLDRHGDGRLEDRYLTFVYSPLRTASGTIDGVLVIAFDVTEQVRARAEVDGLRAAAEAANAAKDEFLAILGHELRNPLSPILTAIHLMRMRGGGAVEKEADIIERQATHLVRLVDDLLDVSRITRGKIELRRDRVELAAIVARGIEMAAPLIEERAHDLTVDVAAEGLAVDVDPGRLAQAVSNLVANAAKYTEPGGHITVTAVRADDRITLRVRDTGIGIDREMLPRVFDLFVQERQAIDRAQGGLGLGLAIVRQLVELHGGRVDAHSDGPGRGSEFVIELDAAPAETSAHPAIAPALRAPVDAPAPRRILVVDDNRDAAELLAEALEAMGHHTRIAHDGPSALVVAKEFIPDTALLDIGLPAMDGYDLARRMRQLDGLATMRLVAVTGYGQAADRQRAADAGFDRHLVKPVRLETLSTLLLDLPA